MGVQFSPATPPKTMALCTYKFGTYWALAQVKNLLYWYLQIFTNCYSAYNTTSRPFFFANQTQKTGIRHHNPIIKIFRVTQNSP